MDSKILSVCLYGTSMGLLEQNQQGKMQFRYHTNAPYALSVGMPKHDEPYDHARCEAFFGGLLPESKVAKRAIAQRYHISPTNTFALLKAIGYDCAGAISFHHPDEPVPPTTSSALETEIISEDQLYERLKALPRRPLFLDFKGLRLSLAGVHDKAAVCLFQNQIALPKSGCPTTQF